MATGTLGTTAQTSFKSVAFQPGMSAADLASINASIYKDNQPANNSIPITSGADTLSSSGILSLPGGRGDIYLKPGDYIAVDPTTGWPIVVSANCAANGAIVHT